MQRIAAILIVLTTGFVTPAHAVEFAGGTGQPNDPYQIATTEQLIAMGQDAALSDRHFVLVADVDLDPSLPGGGFFREAIIAPPASVASRRGSPPRTAFNGSFDGAGHAIRNCTIYTQDYGLSVALFESIGPQGCVWNLRMENAMIAGVAVNFSGYCAALAGENAGLIVDCSVEGLVVTGGQRNQGGGLVGLNTGTLIRCHSRCDVSGVSVGGLVGSNGASGRIEFCSSGGAVIDFGTASSTVGGLVGTNFGVVRCCSSAGYVLADRAGGLVGTNSGTIRESFCLANLLAGQLSGGLAAVNSGTILNGYVPVSVPGDGLVGVNTGSIASCYSVTASQPQPAPRGRSIRSGLLAAEAGGTGVRYVYYFDAAKPEVPASRFVLFGYGMPLSALQMADRGSFVGFDFQGDANDGTEDHWFMPPEGYPVLAWQTQHTGLTGVPDVAGLSVEQARALLERTGFEVGGVDYDYFTEREVCYVEFERRYCETFCPKGQAAYSTPAYVASGTPVKIVAGKGAYDFAQNPGDGSEGNPFQIETAGQFENLRTRPDLWNSRFILTADIDLTHRVYRRPVIDSFGGTLDGNGYCIRGITIQSSEYRMGALGLFGTIGKSGVVRDLTLQGAALDCPDILITMGLLAGENQGRIERCRVFGRIMGIGLAGGLVGLNRGQVIDSQAGGSVWTKSGAAGGLVGDNQGLIEGCCARGIDVYAHEQVGGLVGWSHDDSACIQNCYAQGSVLGPYRTGGLLGQNGAMVSSGPSRFEKGEVRNCYAACSVTGSGDVGPCIGLASPVAVQEGCFSLSLEVSRSNGLGTPLTAEQMKQQASFAGWDFENVWMVCEGRGYPRLKWEGIACDE
jgi:hypothetical protein